MRVSYFKFFLNYGKNTEVVKIMTFADLIGNISYEINVGDKNKIKNLYLNIEFENNNAIIQNIAMICSIIKDAEHSGEILLLFGYADNNNQDIINREIKKYLSEGLIIKNAFWTIENIEETNIKTVKKNEKEASIILNYSFEKMVTKQMKENLIKQISTNFTGKTIDYASITENNNILIDGTNIPVSRLADFDFVEKKIKGKQVDKEKLRNNLLCVIMPNIKGISQ